MIDFSKASLAVVLCMSIGTAAWADSGNAVVEQRLKEMEQRLQEQQRQIQSQAKEISRLRGDDRQRALSERETEEVMGLIEDVLRDAERRTSLQGNNMVAGNRNGSFFISSGDGNFELNLDGGVQIRWAGAFQGGSGGPDGNDSATGFEVRRTKLRFSGNVANPNLGYEARLTASRGSENVSADTLILSYRLSDEITVFGGELRGPFLREELVEPFEQLTAERTLLSEVLTIGFVQGVGIDVAIGDNFRSRTVFSDGANSGEGGARGFESTSAEFAVSSRVDVKLDGDWAQWREFANFRGGNSVFVGAGIHFEEGDSSDPTNTIDHISAATVDGSIQQGPVSIFSALTVSRIERFGAMHDQTLFGGMIQGAFQLVPDKVEPFVRVEFLDIDGGTTDSTSNDTILIITAGVNYFIAGPNARLIIDVSYANDPIPSPSELGIGAGTLGGTGFQEDSSGEDGQIVIRLQLNFKM